MLRNYSSHQAKSFLLGTEIDTDEIDINSIEAIKISIASPEMILQWSRRHCRQTDKKGNCKCGKSKEEQEKCAFGEVKKPETINYRTFKPEKDGLFCERIFGPTKDWECNCGKYKRIKYKGIVCDRCGVEVIQSKVRRTRLGHIKLATVVSHIWFYKGSPSRIGTLLDLSVKDLGRIIYFQDYLVINPVKNCPLKKMQIISEEDTRKYKEKYGQELIIKTGAEAVRELLAELDLDRLAAKLSREMRQTSSAQKRNKIIKRLKVVESFRGSGNRPEWMVLTVIPVIPPDLRPLVHLDGGRFATSDLNDLYRRVINRNNRLKRLIELKAPDVILRNEKRMLQEAVDALFDNGKRGKPTRGHNNRPLKSLSDMLKGKQGRFRQNLLGKRVDYSGRSVIVSGPELKFNQCGLPKKMALDLFEPFVIKELEKRGIVNTIKSAKKLMEKEDPVVYDILEDIIKDHPVLLNRAPTLHRLGVQGFMPVIIEGKAIKLHPLSCAAFNADFDGDQMAVHVPLSNEAKIEVMMIALAHNNILSPANGKPIATPSQDIVLGCYYLTKFKEGAKGQGMTFSGPDEVLIAYNSLVADVHAKVKVRIPESGRKVETTVGRVIFSTVLPKEINFFDEEKFPLFANKVQTKKTLAIIIAEAHRICGPEKTADILDRIKSLGYEFAKSGGISISIDDLKVPIIKHKIIDTAKASVEKVQSQYNKGIITDYERYNKVIDIWTHATDQIADEMLKDIEKDREGFNPIFMMAFSGSRGSNQQIRQLAGMRGLMAKPLKKITGGMGEIIESPIASNFREGLTVLEYFISTHGARKGLADTALKTADAGYLTRRLVDVAQDLITTELDCKTIKGIEVEPISEITFQGTKTLESLADRILGRVSLDDVKHPETGEIIVRKNQLIDEEVAQRVEDAGITKMSIRSVLTCEAKRGICCLCYGRNMATGALVDIGEAAGVIAAQSIGEPGTQLTLRTFHIGGTSSIQLEGWYQAREQGAVRYKFKVPPIKNYYDETISIAKAGLIVIEKNGVEIQQLPNIPYGAKVLVKDGEPVEEGKRIVEWDPHNTPILAEFAGKLLFQDIILNSTYREEIDPQTNKIQRVLIEHKEELHPRIIVKAKDKEASYALPAGAYLVKGIEDGVSVKAGVVLARIPREVSRAKDITGGLPRVAELFEARKPKDGAFIAEISGTIKFEGTTKGAKRAVILGDDGKQKSQFNIPSNRHINVRDGDRVQAGEQITDGSVNPHDILRVKGEKAVQEFLLSEVQQVYRLQGVNINDKHIESIIRQMLKKVMVSEVGDTRFLVGQQVDKWVFQEENERVMQLGGEPAKAETKLLGITKSSLETESFISAASFQETTRVLTDAAVKGKIDYLRGLKENVIMGHLIPAGTGIPIYRNIDIMPIDGLGEETEEVKEVEEESTIDEEEDVDLSGMDEDEEEGGEVVEESDENEEEEE